MSRSPRRVHLFVPCMAEVLAPEIAVAAGRCLEAAGCEVVHDPRAACCGQMFLNSGRPRDAARLARKFVRVHASAEAVVMPSGSCAAMVRDHYGELLKGADLAAWESLRGRVFELCEFLAGPAGVGSWGGRLPGKAALHWSCHLPQEGPARASVERLLGGIEGLELLPRPNDECCGFGGVFWTLWRDVSAAIGRRRLAVLGRDAPDLLLLAEPGCAMQLRTVVQEAGGGPRVLHVAEALALALAPAPGEKLWTATAFPVAPAIMVASTDGKTGGSPRFSPLRARAAAAAHDGKLQAAVLKACDHSLAARTRAIGAIDWEAARNAAIDVRKRATAGRAELLGRLVARLESRGVRVHLAETADAACDEVLAIAQAHGSRRVVKAKTMVGEEIGLLPALEGVGLNVLETDLGEFIVQLRGEPPSHITAPALHLSRQDVSKLFSERLGMEPSDEPAVLSAFARTHLRAGFVEADLGIVGVNIAVAATGDLLTITNEGNARLCEALPRVLIAVTGIEKTVETTSDAAALLRVIARSATGQHASAYVSLLRGPAEAGDPFGPREVHLVLVDNGRSALERDPDLATMLQCVRCGACLTACPVYRTIGGHAYGETYPGPMGIVLTCGLRGVRRSPDLSYACTLCGECGRICPAGIDLPGLILKLRARAPKPLMRRLAMRAARASLSGPARLRAAGGAMRWLGHASPAMYAAAARAAGWTGPFPAPCPPERTPDAGRLTSDVLAEKSGTATTFPAPCAMPVASTVGETGGIPHFPDFSLPAFLDRFRAAAGEVIEAADAVREVAALCATLGARTVLVDDAARSAGVASALEAAGLRVLETCDGDLTAATAATADVGVTGCLALVAETGSILLAHGAPDDRIASLLPPVHVVLARPGQLIKTLEQALSLRHGHGAPSATLVTGPSRTADIEKTLILGMHGPRRLVLVLEREGSAG